MSVNKFKFVSPGIFINEIDQSQIARQPEDIGPVVVGRSLKGPMMRPVKVNTLIEFQQLFGIPVAGASNVDVHREGNLLAPTYGAFAAEAYLKNAGPLTFVRLGGFQSPNATDAGKAGWATQASGSSYSTNGGAFGLFVAPISGSGLSAKVSGSATLAAVIYTDGATVGLTGNAVVSSSAVTNGAGVWVRSVNDSAKSFKVAVATGGSASDVETNEINFVENSKNFLRNVLNTNPTKTNSAVTSAGGLKKYWLGPSFETTIANLATGEYAGIIVALRDGTAFEGAKFKKSAQPSSTGWIFSQHKGVPTAFTPRTNENVVQKLFRFHTLSEDTWIQNNVKVSIQNIKLPSSQFNSFGTFSVVVRDIADTDDQPIILERFDQCDIDPTSQNYIAKKIGDINSVWDDNVDRYVELGTYENRSKYIRVEMDLDVAAGAVATDLLPFGFFGPRVLNTITVTGAAGAATPVSGVIGSISSSLDTAFFAVSSSGGINSNAPFTASFVMPTVPTVTTSSNDATTGYYVNRPANIYWGLKTTVGATKKFNKEITEHLLAFPSDLPSDNAASSGRTQYSFIFSLDDVSGSTSSGIYTEAKWEEGQRSGSASITSQIGNNLTGSGTLQDFLNTFNKFTMPLVGGFDGLDITEKEPFNNVETTALANGTTETTSYGFYSVNRAINSVADPEVLDMNALVVPGIKNTAIHQKMIATCEARGDSLAIVDLPGDYQSAFESTTAESSRKPVVDTATNYTKFDLAVNSSYGCAFYPWVMISDVNSGNKVWVPPSVAALGTFGSTQRFSEVWFAPAGFTRGGLSSNKAAGIPVVQVARKLTAKERDQLYEANINPIASFPSEGIVVFGQKTLQSTPSALDRINVRRLMNYVKKEISRISSTVLFDPNTKVTWNRFLAPTERFLRDVQARLGITEFRVVLDETTTTPELVDRNILYAKIFIKPARAIEFIALDFTITNSGASFDD